MTSNFNHQILLKYDLFYFEIFFSHCQKLQGFKYVLLKRSHQHKIRDHERAEARSGLKNTGYSEQHVNERTPASPPLIRASPARARATRTRTHAPKRGWLRRVCPSLSEPFSTWYCGIDSLRRRLDVSTLLCGSCKFFRSSALWWIDSIIMEFWNNLWSYDWWLVLI